MKRESNVRTICIGTALVFFTMFFIFNSLAHIQSRHHKREEQLKATYAAEESIRRLESELNSYLSKSELIKKITESGHTLEGEEFDSLAAMMRDDEHVIEAIETAEDGIVSQVYPMNGNSLAVGLNFFENNERKEAAVLARDSGQYTIAGPFDLVQGGKGVLLFDPIYRSEEKSGEKQFWGFSILVLNWDRFIEEMDLNSLDEAAYHYQIWRKDVTTGEKIIIAQCQDPVLDDALEVACEVPNDIWYIEIEPNDGWYSKDKMLLNSLLCLVLALFVAITYLQFMMRHYKESLYAEKLRKSAEQERAANLAKTGFLARMSHDIRTPLNGIIGLLKIEEKHPDDLELLKKNHEKMMASANHLLALINDVLQMSKLESGEMVLAHEVLNLNRLSMDVLAIIEQRAAESGITLKYDRGSDRIAAPYIYGSSLHIRQIFLNIYGNCIKYNHPGGMVETHVDCLDITDEKVTYRWTITDTGIGMSEEFLNHIFEPFAQEHNDARSTYNGTGLGMSIVKALIDKMGGTIEVSSRENIGSTFVITLPFELAKGRKEALEVPTETEDISGLHILLVEDNELNAEIAETLLKDEGAEIILAKDGQEATDIFQKNPPKTFDVILMDVMMPRMDGLTATRNIRTMDRPDAKTIPIIAMTANAFAEDAQKCLDAGMNGHLAKPLHMDQVIATIARYTKGEKR